MQFDNHFQIGGFVTESKRGYSTRQRAAVLDFFKAHPGECFTAAQVYAQMTGRAGQTTVYRCLDLLEKQGEVLKFATGDGMAAYRLMDGACRRHMHLKCVSCGEIIHMDCGFIDALTAHLRADHAFMLDAARTVIYGRCAACAHKEDGHGAD